jgi:hypothetical protein
MGTVATDAVKRLVDHFDQNRKVFLSSDYKEEQLRAEFLNGPCPMIRHSDLGIRTIPGPLFTALGQVYEQFLGKVIRLTAGHQAKVEERSRDLVPTRVLDGSSAPRGLSAMQSEPRPALTEAR